MPPQIPPPWRLPPRGSRPENFSRRFPPPTLYATENSIPPPRGDNIRPLTHASSDSRAAKGGRAGGKSSGGESLIGKSPGGNSTEPGPCSPSPSSSGARLSERNSDWDSAIRMRPGPRGRWWNSEPDRLPRVCRKLRMSRLSRYPSLRPPLRISRLISANAASNTEGEPSSHRLDSLFTGSWVAAEPPFRYHAGHGYAPYNLARFRMLGQQRRPSTCVTSLI